MEWSDVEKRTARSLSLLSFFRPRAPNPTRTAHPPRVLTSVVFTPLRTLPRQQRPSPPTTHLFPVREIAPFK
jgi:hypothetical protein